MNRYKTVMMPIQVPDCDYCWERNPPYRICPHFDNEGGYPRCAMNIEYLKIEPDFVMGQPKPEACKKLVTVVET